MSPELPRPSLLAPSRLRPVELDLRRVFWAGIALWGLALVVTGAMALAGQLPVRPVAVSATGFGLGFLALLWERRRRATATR